MERPAPLIKKTLVDQLVQSLSRAIFRRELKPGELLPPLRALAGDYGVTVPTAQRAVARLEQMGLVDVRHGSGMRVIDPALRANLGCLSDWLDALLDAPEEARQLASELLELRRDVVVLATLRVRRFVRTRTFAPITTATDHLFKLCALSGADPEALMRADMAVLRSLLVVRPQRALGATFNGLEQALERVEVFRRAMYAEPEQNAMSYRMILDFLASRRQDEDLQWLIDTVLADLDTATLDRLGRLLAAP